MGEQENSSINKTNIKRIIIFVVILAILTTGVILLSLHLKRLVEGHSSEEQVEMTDELKRAKHFISDWYVELSEDGNSCVVYFNELRINNGQFTLTYAGKRIRAVYPRGERFFKFYLIDKLEFFETGGKIRCRLYYWGDSEYTFALE